MSDLTQPESENSGREVAGPAALPVPEAAATNPWALVALAAGAIVSVMLWRRRAKG
ncbi:hypothetical protein [Actinoplanes italicus]|uniref:hypothetical protein n=1 Tax=Actinoplanes italicus TaxID=113567 RepID=UPI001473CBE9|nr:hypothetical protein [Actinoplanes italicus]